MRKIFLILLFNILIFSISFASDNIFSISKYIGDEFNIEKSIESVVSNYEDYVFSWTASNYDIINIFPNGHAKCIKDGRVQLVGHDELKNKTIYINVNVKNQVTNIDLGTKELYVPEDFELKLKTSLYYDYKEKLRSDEVNFTSSNENVVVVTSNGSIKILSSGSSYVIASSKDGSHKDYIKIIVDSKKLNIDVSYKDETNVFEKHRIEIKSDGKNVSNFNYRYISSDESIVSISSSGEITSNNVGVAYITITDGSNKRMIVPIKVNPIIKAIEVEKKKITINSLDDLNLIKYKLDYISDVYESNQVNNIKFSSSVPHVAYVTPDGKIVPRASGIAFVTVSTNNGNTSDVIEVNVDVPLSNSVIYNFKFNSLPKKMYVGEVAKLDYTVKSVLMKPEFRFTLSKGSNSQIYDENGVYYFKPNASGTVDINVKGPNGFQYKYPVVVATKLSKIDLNTGMYTKENDGYRIFNGQDVVIEPNFIMSGSYTKEDLLNKDVKIVSDNEYINLYKGKNNIIEAIKVGNSNLKIISEDFYKVFNTKIYVKSAVSNFKLAENQVGIVGEVFYPKTNYTFVHNLGKIYNDKFNIEIISQSVSIKFIEEEIIKTQIEIDRLNKEKIVDRTLMNRLNIRKTKLLSMKENSYNAYTTLTSDFYDLNGRKFNVANVYGDYMVGLNKGLVKIRVTLEDNGKTAFEQIEFK